MTADKVRRFLYQMQEAMDDGSRAWRRRAEAMERERDDWKNTAHAEARIRWAESTRANAEKNRADAAQQRVVELARALHRECRHEIGECYVPQETLDALAASGWYETP